MKEKWLNIYSHYDFEKTLNKRGIDDGNVDSIEDEAFIDIIGKGIDEDYSHYFKESHDNVINLEFDDIDKDVEIFGSDKLYGITDEQAERLVDFIKEHQDKSFTMCCIAGQSRSQAVGNFIDQAFPNQFQSHTLLKHPNPNVLAKLKRVWFGYGDK